MSAHLMLIYNIVTCAPGGVHVKFRRNSEEGNQGWLPGIGGLLRLGGCFQKAKWNHAVTFLKNIQDSV